MFGMKAYLLDKHLLVTRSRSYAKVKVKVKYHGHIPPKLAVLRVLVSHKHILFQIEIFGTVIAQGKQKKSTECCIDRNHPK